MDSSAPLPRISFRQLQSVWTILIFIPLLILVLDPGALPDLLKDAGKSFIGTLPFILFAVGLIAYLKAAGAEAMIADAFKGRETRMIFLAALFGGLAPFCSCEVIPFIAAMLALGTPLSAIMAFWLASPLIDPPTLLITAAALGWPFAIAKAVSAVGLGILGGFAIMAWRATGTLVDPLRPQPQSGCGCGPTLDGRPMWRFWVEEKRRDVFRNQFVDNAIFLTKWLLLAYLLEAIMLHYVPQSVISNLLGGEGLFPIVTAAVIGMPAYLNGYVAAPLLAGLVEQGMGVGAALSFMIAGSVSCIPAMAAVWSLVRVPVFAAYVLLGLSGAILFGILFQIIS